MFTNEETTFADINFFLNFLSSFIFEENHIVEENNPAKKIEKYHGRSRWY